MEEGINGVLSIAVGSISVDGAICYDLMVLLNVQPTWERVSYWFVQGWGWERQGER